MVSQSSANNLASRGTPLSFLAALGMTGECPETGLAQYYVYILTNGKRNLYVGVTNDLVRRVYEHKNKLVCGFTKRYNLSWLAYFETTSEIESAIAREKQIKGWRRSKKIALVESQNSQWKDLAMKWYDE